MSDFKRVAFVWGGFAEHKPVPVQVVPSLGIMGMAGVLGCDVLSWEDRPPDLSQYDVFLVVMFALGRRQVADIRAARPDALIVGLPDPPPEHVFYPDHIDRAGRLLDKLALCDAIGARCLDGRDVALYTTMLDKPWVAMPGPLQTAAWFGALSETIESEDLIVTCDHSWNPQRTAGNVAAVARLQRETGWPVIYANATPHTQQMARAARMIDVTFYPKLPLADFAALAARARIGIDLYAAHSMGRNGIVFAAVGTPCITSRTTQSAGHPQVDPGRPDEAVREALALIDDQGRALEVIIAGDRAIEAYSVRATRERVRALLERQGV